MHRSLLFVALALACSGCASDGFAPALSADLSGQAEAIAARLEAGDTCRAATAVKELRAEADAAVRDGAVPISLAEGLDRRITELEAVRCVPPPTVAPARDEDDDEDREDRGDRKRGKGRDKHGDDDD